MTDAPDTELLAQFTRDNSETAFAALVERHIGLVHSVALRHTTHPQHAQDIMQAVFIILAKKADRLPKHAVLPGWLYNTARLTAANFKRTEARRIRREQETYMQSILQETAPDELWPELSPLLDEAMSRLGATDRDALVLRYFQNKTLPEVGTALGLEERAAQKRVTRAVEKLRKIFAKRGVTLAATAIAGAVSANSIQAAPVGLVKIISAVAVGQGATATTSTLTLVKGAMKLMAWTKMKTSIVIGIGILIAGGASPILITKENKWAAQKIAQQSQDAYAALASYTDDGFGVAEGGGEKSERTFSIQLQRRNQYRIEWASPGGLYPDKGLAWSDGRENFLLSGSPDNFKTAMPRIPRDMAQTFSFAGGSSGSVASTIPGIFFKIASGGDSLEIAALGRTVLKRDADEKIGGVDCYTVVSILNAAKLLSNLKMPATATIDLKSLGATTTTFWIGKQDHLIRRVKTTTLGMIMKWTDAMLTIQLNRRNEPVTPENLAALRTEMEKSQALANASGFVFTETHDHIVVNQKFSQSDFAR